MNSRFLGTGLAVTLLLAIAGSPESRLGANQRARQGRPVVHAKTMTLDELAENAETIFVGKVVSAEVGPETLEQNGKAIKADIRRVTFDVQQVLKGDLAMGERHTFRQLDTISAPVKEGEELLWYLPSKSRLGLVQPLGVYSGHFRIVPDPMDNDYRAAINLVNNEGLWGGPAQYSVKGPLVKNPEEVINKFEGMDVPQARVAQLSNMLRGGTRPGAVPLELLISVTLNEVESNDDQ